MISDVRRKKNLHRKTRIINLTGGQVLLLSHIIIIIIIIIIIVQGLWL